MIQQVQRPDLKQLKIRAKELLRAVNQGDADAIARALPYFRSSERFTLTNAQLVIARENGFDSWARLRNSLASTDQPDRSPTEALFALLDARDEDAASKLVASHPELAGAWQKRRWGWVSPLHLAAENGLRKTAEALIEAGAEIYAVNQGGYPPVFGALPAHPDLAEFLMNASAAKDGGIPPTYGCGIDIVLAARLGLLDRVKMHVDKDPLAIFRRGCIGETVLHWPAHNGHVEVLEYLLDRGALIEADEIGLYGGKPLHWAAEHEPESVRLLLARGADPGSRNLMPGEFQSYTPLHMAARQREQCIECARLLLSAGADPAALDAKNCTPFEVARESGRTKMEEFLVGIGPSPP